MKVGIKFSDNDFCRPIKMFIEMYILPTFVEREEGHMITHLTTSQIVELFNTYCVYCYKKWQEDKENNNWKMDKGYIKQYKEYLKITDMNVYWDNKTDNRVGDWETANNNCEFIWTDGEEVFIS